MITVIATPHARYDCLEDALRRERLDFVRLRTPEELTPERLAALQPRYVFFPHWSWKIPPEIFQNHECVIFHMTDLPFGRGGSPLQNLIVRGFRETRLSALRCVAEMDAGPVYLKEPLSLLGTAEEILMRAAQLMASMMLAIVRTNPMPVPQQGEPTILKRRRPEDGNIAGLEDLNRVYDFIRMLDAEGYPPAFMETEHLRFEFTRAALKPGEVRADVKIVRKTP
ncbi:MAG TPA: methionyl-tRNA formyltransferase [Sedimenticola sp.]|nr:methionyl-tRNA formyltransferase [Sedimenticola sp.]